MWKRENRREIKCLLAEIQKIRGLFVLVWLNDITHSPLLLQLCSCLHVVKVQPPPVSNMSPAALFAVGVWCWAWASRVIQEVTDRLVAIRLRRTVGSVTQFYLKFHYVHKKKKRFPSIVLLMCRLVSSQNNIKDLSFLSKRGHWRTEKQKKTDIRTKCWKKKENKMIK